MMSSTWGEINLLINDEGNSHPTHHYPPQLPPTPPPLPLPPSLTLLQPQTGEETFFKIKKSTKMSKVMETYAKRKGVDIASLRFLVDGERVQGEDTPKTLELDDQDQIGKIHLLSRLF